MTKNDFIKNVYKTFSLKIDLNNLNNQLDIYKFFLQQENKKMNLTRLDCDDIIWLKYFWHTIVTYRFIDFTKIKTILDVGSGSGIPGIVLKLFFPNICLTIVESNHKKCLFLKELVKKLNLKNVNIVCQRIENMQNKNQFDLVTAKAVEPLEIILEMLIPFAKINGLIVIPKGKKFLSEIKNLTKELNQLGSVLKFIDHIIDNKQDFFTIIAIKKTQTCKKYPRQYKEMIKGFDYAK